MTKPISNLRFEYMNTSERRVLNLETVGVPTVPMLGYCNYRNPRPDVPEHWHPECLEIHYGVRNTLSFGFNERVYRLAPGDVFVSLPDEHHTVGSHPKGLIMYWMILRLETPEKTFLKQPPEEAEALRQALLNLPHRLFRGSERIKRLFQALHMLHDEPASHLRTLRLRTTTLALLMEVVDAAKSHVIPPDRSRLEAILRDIEANPQKNRSIETLARQAGMAPTHFIARFRALTGLPPRQFMLTCRMRRACHLLQTTETSVTAIALDLGFCSSQHFANLFKRHTGITPLGCRHGDPGPLRFSDTDDGQSPAGK